MGKRVIGRTDAILILLYGDQTKGLSFNWTISTDHLSFDWVSAMYNCIIELFLLLLYFLGGLGGGGGVGG